VWEDDPLRVPAVLWTNGTVSALSAAALAVLLVLWDYEAEKGVVISVPKSRAYEYPVTHATWHKGTAELEACGFVARHNGPLLFQATNANPKVTSNRHRLRWQLNHDALIVGFGSA
jgi:hypothetical protein